MLILLTISLYTAISIKIVPEQSGKVEYERKSRIRTEKSNTSAKSLLGVTIKNTRTEQNLVSRDTSCELYS